MFSNTNSHLCVMQQTSSSSSSNNSNSSSILIYDLDRGVLATTLDVRADNSSAAADTPKKKKARKSMNAGNEVLCDIATGTDTDNQLYALVDINGKCRLYQYDLVGKKKGEVTLVKKIKVGSIPASSGEDNGSSPAVVFGLTVSKDVIVVRLGSTVRVHDVNSGEKLGKIDLPGDVVMAASSSSSIEDANAAKKFVPLVITSDGRYIVTSIHNQAVVLSCSNNKDEDGNDEFKLQMVAVLSTKDDNSSIVYLDGATTTTTVDNDKKLMVLAFQPTVGIASLFSVSTSSGGKKKKKANSSSSFSLVPQLPQAQLETKQEEGHASHSSLVFTHAGFHPRNPNEAMLLLFQRSKSRSGSASGSGTSLPMESLPYNNADDDASPLEGTVMVGTSLIRGDKNANKDGKNKRKAANNNDNVALAPGDQGQEAGLAQDLTSSLGKNSKKARKGGDDDNGKDEVVGGDEDGFDDLEEEEDGEPGQSIAERLALLSSAMEQTDEEDDEDGSDDDDDDAEMTEISTNFKPNSATSETLTTLLTQALSSNDSNQLNIALQVTDRRLVEGTIRALQSLDAERAAAAAAAAASQNRNEEGSSSPSSSGYISTLMAHIVRRMARRHSLVMPLGVWVKAILAATARSTANVQAGSAVEEQMAREGREMAMKLGPLKNFLNERVECFPQLLRLEGRLALLSQQL